MYLFNLSTPSNMVGDVVLLPKSYLSIFYFYDFVHCIADHFSRNYILFFWLENEVVSSLILTMSH